VATAAGRPSSVELDERFPGADLDRSVWLPYHLPHWSSRAESAATYAVRDGELHLTIPPDQGLWCADRHPDPLRVSCIQSASWSGPIGSTRGPQPFRDGLTVRSEEPPFWGYVPASGHVDIRMRGVIGPRSMVAFYLSAIELEPEQSGELCVAEIFGDALGDGTAAVGMGVKAKRDPDLRDDFEAPRLPIDVAAFHTYAVDWGPGAATFSVDGRPIRSLDQAPADPLQLMIGVFDFPARPIGPADPAAPELIVSHVRGGPVRAG
jgi:hypothetical protein